MSFSATTIDLVFVPILILLAPLIVTAVSRVAPVPLAVVEILLGVVFGPSLLGIVTPTDFLATLGQIGAAMLFFLAGNEIDVRQIAGRPLRSAFIGWCVTFVCALAIGLGFTSTAQAGMVVAIALSSTALGMLLPILKDAGDLASPFGRAISATGAVGEFGPLLAMALLLSGKPIVTSVIVLAVFAIIAALAIWFAARRSHPRLHALIAKTQHNSAQVAIRIVLFTMAVLIGVDLVLGLDVLLGAFTAGVVVRVLLQDAPHHEVELTESKLQALGFGFLVPVFFVNTGVVFDLRSLTRDPSALALLAVVFVLLLVVRGIPGSFAAPKGAKAADRLATGFFAATGLPIVVAVTGLGVESRAITASTAAALVGAAMLSVLVFPAVALALRARGDHTVASAGGPDAEPDVEPDDVFITSTGRRLSN